jgi:hypothetical protein
LAIKDCRPPPTRRYGDNAMQSEGALSLASSVVVEIRR